MIGRQSAAQQSGARRPGAAPLAVRLLGAAAAGAALTLAFPPYGWWPLAAGAAGGLVLLCRDQRPRTGFVVGLVAGLAVFVPLLHWSNNVGNDAWLALAAAQALPVGLLGAGLAAVTRLGGWPLWSAALWVAEEAVRARVPFGGFPWGRVAFSQGNTPFTGYAALGGAPLVTFAVALAGGLLAAAWVAAARGRRPAAAFTLLAAAAVGAAGRGVPARLATDGSATVAVVQGNVPRLGLDFNAQRAAVLRNHAAATLRLADSVRTGRAPRPDLVVWPENASDIDPLRDPAAGALIDSAVHAVGSPVLVGAVLDGPGRFISNVGLVWEPGSGPGRRYVKRHPVPFAEYVPFRPVLAGLVERFSLVPRDFAPGGPPGVLDVGPVRLGDVICFEVGYDGLVRDVVRGGGRLLVVQTNNATFGRSGESPQQLAMSQLRAVEHGRTVLVAATSGISAIVAPDGRVLDRSPVFAAETLVARVPLRSGRTVADRVGAGPEWALVGLGAAALIVAAASRPIPTTGRARRTGRA